MLRPDSKRLDVGGVQIVSLLAETKNSLCSTHDSEAPSCGPAQIQEDMYHVWLGGMCFLAHAILAQAWLGQ